MNTLVEYLLAAMMTIISPGMSNYSQVPVERCGTECQVTPLCENTHDFRCKPPRFNKALYLQRQGELVAQGMDPADAPTEALEFAYSRPETYEEGLARYYIIASAIVEAAQMNSYGYCLAENECKSKPAVAPDESEEETLQECFLDCSRKKLWQKPTAQLAWALFSVSTFESGWRSDVQSGTGWAGRGDCAWEKPVKLEDGTEVQRRVKPWTEGGHPVVSTCRSFGLTQVMFGNPPRELSSYNQKMTYDMVLGLDKASSIRSLDLAARYLYMGWRTCNNSEDNWAWSMFSMYGSGSSCRVESSKSRSSRFWKYSYKPNLKKLKPRHLEALATPEVQALITHLEDATTPVLWMPSVKYVPKPKEIQEVIEIASN